MLDAYYFNIEILGMGQCNLRCPSCPTGNYREIQNPMGMMSPELLDQIMAKAKRECIISGVGLFNWAEPLIHPKIGEMISAVKNHGVICDLSSNLNDIRNIEQALSANPSSLRISTSGFTQDVYGKTHRGGNIEVVKKNMKTLAELKEKLKISTKIHVLYHRYKHNLDDERLMKRYAMDLGFDFIAAWAYFMPLEKMIAFLDGDPTGKMIKQEDRNVIDLLALHPAEAVKMTREMKSMPCQLKDKQITLDFRGKTMLCCTLYDADKFGVGEYLSTPISEIQRNKKKQEICTRCTADGLHSYYTYATPAVQVQSVRNLLEQTMQYLVDTPAAGAGGQIRIEARSSP